MLHFFLQVAAPLERRLVWAAFGASSTLALVSLRSVPSPAAAMAPPDVHVHIEGAPTSAAPPAPAPLPTFAERVSPPPIGYRGERRVLSPSDLSACVTARAGNGIYAAPWSTTYITRLAADRFLDRHVRPGLPTSLVPAPLVGLQVAGARFGDPLLRLGFANGDVLLGINGNDLSTPKRAGEAYLRLSDAEDFSVVYLRTGKAGVRLLRICDRD